MLGYVDIFLSLLLHRNSPFLRFIVSDNVSSPMCSLCWMSGKPARSSDSILAVDHRAKSVVSKSCPLFLWWLNKISRVASVSQTVLVGDGQQSPKGSFPPPRPLLFVPHFIRRIPRSTFKSQSGSPQGLRMGEPRGFPGGTSVGWKEGENPWCAMEASEDFGLEMSISYLLPDHTRMTTSELEWKACEKFWTSVYFFNRLVVFEPLGQIRLERRWYLSFKSLSLLSHLWITV